MEPYDFRKRRQQSRGRGWALALLAGFVLRAGLMTVHARFQGDTLIYGDLARNLLQHHVYGLTEDGHIRATLIRLPGYPLFLALCFLLFGTNNYVTVLWVQVGVDLVSCWLLGRLTMRLVGPRAGLCCVWLAALCLFTANYAVAALTETLSIFCVVLAFWGFVGWLEALRRSETGRLWAAVTGAALCGAVLLRPDGILLLGSVLPAMLWATLREGALQTSEFDNPAAIRVRTNGWYGLLLAAGLPLVCLAGWTARNWRLYHVVQPLAPKYANDPGESAPVGFARWYRTWGTGLGDTARVYWEYDGSALSLQDLPRWAFDSESQRAETAAIYRQYNEETSSTPEVEQAFTRLAQQRERAHPLRSFVGMPVARLADMWLRPRTELLPRMPVQWWKWRQRPRATLLAVALGIANLLLLGAALHGYAVWRRRGWDGYGIVVASMLGYVVLRSVLLLTIDNSEPRYVLEGYPVVLLLTAVAFTRPLLPTGKGER